VTSDFDSKVNAVIDCVTQWATHAELTPPEECAEHVRHRAGEMQIDLAEIQAAARWLRNGKFQQCLPKADADYCRQVADLLEGKSN
jgi:hypothetical protein